MDESKVTRVSNLTNNDHLPKFTKDSLTSHSSNQSTFKSSFANSTIRTTLSVEEIESRRSGFEKFITSLPKICSPTICGTLNYKTPNSRLFSSVCSSKTTNTRSENDTSGYHTASLNKAENSTKSNCNAKLDSTSCPHDEECKHAFKNPFEEKINKMIGKSNEATEDAPKEDGEELNNEFDWSIDQIALLNPCDITFDDNFLIYKEFEELNKSILHKESEAFFKQNLIAPSPIVNTPILARKRLIQNVCKTSSPFIDYLNSKKKSIFKTPLQLSGIKSATSSNNGHSSITSHQHTPINDLSVLDELNLPKKKLFHKFESSSLTKSFSNQSNCSPALSEISQLNNSQLNCTDLDCRRFTLDISEIENEINLNESNRVIKSSTNRKEMRKLIEDLVEEDEEEIKELNLNDTNEEMNKVDVNVEKNEIETVIKTNEIEDNQMSISIQPESMVNNTSLMECSFQTARNEFGGHVNNVNQLINQISTQNHNEPQVNEHNQPEILNRDEHRINDIDDIQMMETSMMCSLEFNDKIEPPCKPFKNQLTSTPFRL